jgi:hypothetical protein
VATCDTPNGASGCKKYQNISIWFRIDRYWLESLKGMNCSEVVGVGGKIILKSIIEK